jgi:diguanylate cyclase (GGDEF)-like protein
VVVLAATSIALGLLTGTLLVLDWMSSRAMLQDRLSTLADVVGRNSTASLDFNDQAAAVEILQALRREPSVFSGCLYDAREGLFAEYQRQPGEHVCPQDRTRLWVERSDVCRVVRPVFRAEERVGTLFLESDLQEVQLRRRRLLLVAGILALLALVVGGVAGSLLQRRVTRPIFDLVQTMEKVRAGGNLAMRAKVSESGEIAVLERGFNRMLSELERQEEEKRKAETKLQDQARTDALTGLPNRRLFGEQLAQSLSWAQRESRTVGLLFIDLDGFKLVNDSLGHLLGDRLLCEVGKRLQSRLRQSDLLARLGGDEFTVILRTLKRTEEGQVVAQALLDTLALPFRIGEHEITIGASIGISIFPDHASTPADLMWQADSAMYAAKRNGRNQAMYFRPDLGALVRERLNLENQLRRAIGRGEIEIFYQPEYEVTTERLVRFEALARWQHPTLGWVPPAKFIPIAEESGLIVPLGAYILERACTQALEWQAVASHPVQVAVNVSSVQFNRDNFVEEVSDTLTRTGLRPELLQLELTETVMMGPVERSTQKLKRLRELGISLAIDDFGTGYSCLSYLPSLPFDMLKIDRSFVKDLDSKPETIALIRSLVGLAHNIGMQVIVEGVESRQQVKVIRELAVNQMQGFLLGRPSPEPLAVLAAHAKQSTAPTRS